ncbi:uncharacterized protein LOC6561829 [Drosophila grimshawi]|uniref:GH10998 n=1 Tax=Drosophila grimshawi TaxID=7222 RepID=B4JBR4_DROGR|nr:uncharacterized protein LOC6561829 [Drosophila grimshawi]EDW02999.1 GH10998 [Drosophila grimshawi]
MFKNCIPLLLFFTACVALTSGAKISSGEALTRNAVLTGIQPRFIGWNRRGNDNQQPPIIIVQPNQNSDRHQHSPSYWPDYYPYPGVAPPRRPPFQFPGLGEYLNGSGSIVIVNPNNAQNLSFQGAAPAATDAGAGGGGRRSAPRNIGYRHNVIPVVELLQGSIADENFDEINLPSYEPEAAGATAAIAKPAPALAPAPAPYDGDEYPFDGIASDDELALLERQASRGLSTKNLLSFLIQDKRRRRFQEAIAGIYLKNYNQNRK